MDRETLNEYMWIIVVVLVGMTLLAFAGGYGELLKDYIINTTTPAIEEYQEPVDISDHLGVANEMSYSITQ